MTPPASDETPRRFYLRTYGCQMNEHDSERIAGLLAADGMEPTDDLDAADVVVLNTCCIRENADNKLYGTLGHLKSRKDARPDLQIVVGGCLAQKDRDQVRARAPYVDVVLGTHNVHRASELVARARTEGPVTEVSFIRVKDGKMMDYMNYLKGTWRSEHEAEKKAGLITDYHIYGSAPRNPQDANMILTVTYPNYGALDKVSEFEAIASKLEGSLKAADKGYADRGSIREVLGSELVQELILK